MKRPLTGLVVVYAAGIWLGSIVNWPVVVISGLVAVFLIGFVAFRHRRHCLALLLLAVLAAGALAYRLAVSNSSPNHISLLVERRDQNISLRGVIVTDPGYREAEGADAEPANDRHSFLLELDALNTRGEWIPASGRVLMFVAAARAPQLLHYGDRIECTALLRVPAPAHNPGTFDWQRWLTRQNIPFTATLRKADSCAVLETGRGRRLMALSLRLREHCERALRVGLENEPKLAGVLAGMVIGQRTEIPPETYDDFQQTGVFHVFAISGLHVGIVTGVVVLLLRLARIPRRWCGLIAIPLLVIYVFATGARPGAVRALVMACVWLISWMLVRPADGLSNLAAAALLILGVAPMQLFDGGFILSFGVVLSLLVLAPRIQAVLERLIARDELLPGQVAPRWRIWTERPALWFLQLLSCSLAAWIGLLPLMAVYFHLFTPISTLANVLVVPLLGFIITLGMLGAMAHAVWPWLALTFNNANFFLLGTMIRGVEWLGNIPGGHHFVRAPPVWLVAGYYVVLALLLSGRLSWRNKTVIAVPAFAVVMFLAAWPESAVEVTALDLRDGMAVFVNAPGEGEDWLIDGGGDWSGRRVVVPYLRAQGVDRLSAVVLTRGDKAHAAGLRDVLANVPTARARHGATGSRSKFFWDWLDFVRQRQLPIEHLRAGDAWDSAAGLRVNVLHPPRDSAYTRSDDNSIVLLIEFGPNRVLLTSDAGATVERRLLESRTDVRADVIIKGRHSDETSCTDEFLDAVRPAAVVQCVNVWPRGRYLQPEVRDRLRLRSIVEYRTDETGAVTVQLTRRGYAIRTCFAGHPQLVKTP
jgi:competence protein ComEC